MSNEFFEMTIRFDNQVLIAKPWLISLVAAIDVEDQEATEVWFTNFREALENQVPPHLIINGVRYDFSPMTIFQATEIEKWIDSNSGVAVFNEIMAKAIGISPELLESVPLKEVLTVYKVWYRQANKS